jgi:hypothetical protein
MKLVKSLGLLLLSGAFAFTANAQKIKVTEGSLDALEGVKEYNIEFTYQNMAVGKFKTEAEYIDKKKAEYNKKEAGKGDKWAEAWVDDRASRFEPKFIEKFEEYSGAKAKGSAKYTLIFNTSFTEPGFNIGITQKNASINGEVTIVETANKSKVVAKITIEKVPGRTGSGYDFDTGERISESYEKAGKEIGKKLK